jgi:hypothetical protein
VSAAPAFTRRRVVVSVLLAAAAVGTVYAFTLHEEPEPLRFANPAVRTVYPKPGERVLRQTTVFVELAAGHDVRDIVIQGTAVQRRDLEVIPGLNRFGYTPGEGKVIEELEPERTCPTVEFVDTSVADSPLQSFSWCFSLH